MLGEPDWLRDSKWWQPGLTARVELVDEFHAHFLPWSLERGKREIWAAAREAKVLCGPLFSVDELFDDTHFSDRGFWAQAEHAELGEVQLPGRPFIMPASPWSLRRPAPLLGEHRDEVLSELGYDAAAVADMRSSGLIA